MALSAIIRTNSDKFKLITKFNVISNLLLLLNNKIKIKKEIKKNIALYFVAFYIRYSVDRLNRFKYLKKLGN